MKFHSSSTLAAVLATTVSLARADGEKLCGDDEGKTAGSYTLNNNAWGAKGQGVQCLTIDHVDDSNAAWHADFNIPNGNAGQVATYPYAGLDIQSPKLLKDTTGLQTSFSWGLSNSNVAANVAYDLFTAADPGHVKSSGDFELMIWLSSPGGPQPIGSNTGTVEVPNHGSWELWDGDNAGMHVYSFKSASDQSSFNGDVLDFFKFLKDNKGFNFDNQYLITFQAGIEARQGGPSTFQVNTFTASVA